MGGVDLMDRNIPLLRTGTRSKKWWWPLFRFPLDTAVHNSGLLYRASDADTHERLTQLHFRRALVENLLAKYGTE